VKNQDTESNKNV